MRTRKSCFLAGLLFAAGLGLAVSAAAQQSRNVKVMVTTAEGKSVNLYGASYALVVGVSNYTNGWPFLREAVNDAREVKTALERQNFNVTLVENPTAAQLKTAIENFVAVAGQGAENRLLFYFAGHGHTLKMDYGGDLGYIVPGDAPLPNKDRSGFQLKAISMENFNSYARGINAKHALFLFDSCFSGSIFALARGVPDAITHKTSLPVRQFITAGSAYETVPDKSIFKQQFLAALQGEGDKYPDGYVTGNELGEFLYTTVTNYSNDSQHPQYGTIRDRNLDKGDFVFVVPEDVRPKLDLNRYKAEAEKARWINWQQKMTASFQETQGLDGDANLPAASKARMWQEFLQSYAADNPYSQEDDRLRREAGQRQNYWSTYKPSPTTYQPPPVQPTRAAPNGMALIPAGSFMMGSTDGDSDEKPVHEVYVDAFYMDMYEVTVEQFKQFVDATNYKTEAEREGWSYVWNGKEWEKKSGVNWRHDPKGETAGGRYPVINVSWNDAKTYADWAGKKLPTEAQWEYAARSGTKGYKYAWGNGDPSGKRGGNIADEAAGRVFSSWTIWRGYDDGYVYTAPVGSFTPNDFGLYDMTGNVREWCADWYAEDYYQKSPKQNPPGATTGTYRVLRGGSWYGDPNCVRCAYRGRISPTNRDDVVGFRCVQDAR